MRFPSAPLFLSAPAAAAVLGSNPGHVQQPLIEGTSQFSNIPSLGFGTSGLDKSNVSEIVSAALRVGYRHIDCATIYGNQRAVGKGIAHGLKSLNLNRSDIWVTSKLWNDHHDPALVEEALTQTLNELGLAYLDLWLMHWPVGKAPDTGKTHVGVGEGFFSQEPDEDR